MGLVFACPPPLELCAGSLPNCEARSRDDRRRSRAPGVVVSPLSLGGALLGAADAAEAAAILRVAVAPVRGDDPALVADGRAGSAYAPAAEERIGESPHDSLVVATKFGNPCELNGHTHDYSVGWLRGCLFQFANAAARQAHRGAAAPLAAGATLAALVAGAPRAARVAQSVGRHRQLGCVGPLGARRAGCRGGRRHAAGAVQRAAAGARSARAVRRDAEGRSCSPPSARAGSPTRVAAARLLLDQPVAPRTTSTPTAGASSCGRSCVRWHRRRRLARRFGLRVSELEDALPGTPRLHVGPRPGAHRRAAPRDGRHHRPLAAGRRVPRGAGGMCRPTRRRLSGAGRPIARCGAGAPDAAAVHRGERCACGTSTAAPRARADAAPRRRRRRVCGGGGGGPPPTLCGRRIT